MARPHSYRRVGQVHKRCGKCKFFIKNNEWCKRWDFTAEDEYVCTKWVKGIRESEEEGELKNEYRKAVGDGIINREENYAKAYTSERINPSSYIFPI